jgi:hypothetical protein
MYQPLISVGLKPGGEYSSGSRYGADRNLIAKGSLYAIYIFCFICVYSLKESRKSYDTYNASGAGR